MTASQRTWTDRYAHRWVIPVDHGDLDTQIAPQPTLDMAAAFARVAPVVIEIGSGHGETLVSAAIAHPEWNLLGFEVFEASIASTLGKLATVCTDNVRIIAGDAVSGLAHLIPDASVSEVWVFFPDPWQKKRHHKRRLISASFTELLASKLVDGGTLRLATDWDDYAESMDTVLEASPLFTLLNRDRFPTRPLTKFESRGIAAGRTIHDAAWQRRPR